MISAAARRNGRGSMPLAAIGPAGQQPAQALLDRVGGLLDVHRALHRSSSIANGMLRRTVDRSISPSPRSCSSMTTAAFGLSPAAKP
jgi:hypothetical protein